MYKVLDKVFTNLGCRYVVYAEDEKDVVLKESSAFILALDWALKADCENRTDRYSFPSSNIVKFHEAINDIASTIYEGQAFVIKRGLMKEIEEKYKALSSIVNIKELEDKIAKRDYVTDLDRKVYLVFIFNVLVKKYGFSYASSIFRLFISYLIKAGHSLRYIFNNLLERVYYYDKTPVSIFDLVLDLLEREKKARNLSYEDIIRGCIFILESHERNMIMVESIIRHVYDDDYKGKCDTVSIDDVCHYIYSRIGNTTIPGNYYNDCSSQCN